MDALGDELEFEEEDVPSYLQEDEVDLPKASETDPKLVSRIWTSVYIRLLIYIIATGC